MAEIGEGPCDLIFVTSLFVQLCSLLCNYCFSLREVRALRWGLLSVVELMISEACFASLSAAVAQMRSVSGDLGNE